MHKQADNSFDAILSAIGGAGRIAIATHVNPDGDAAGASLALCLLLRKLGKDARILMDRDTLGAPGILYRGVETVADPALLPWEPDLLVCLDCADVKRVAPASLAPRVGVWRTVVIDHHHNPGFGDLNYIAPDASSTGELVYDLARHAGWPLSRDVAEALWVAVVTDTGRFSYSCTHPSTLQCAAELLSLGVRAAWLNDELYNQVDERVLRLQQRALATLEKWFGGVVTVISLEASDYAETGCRKSHTEEFVNLARDVRGARLSIFFYALPDDPATAHLSIRSREPAPGESGDPSIPTARELAVNFGGGGHDLAAGATLYCPLAEARRLVREFLSGKGIREAPSSESLPPKKPQG